MVRLSLDSWPSQGRIGLARAGEWAGEYVFVFPEIRGQWAFWSSGGTDDIIPDREFVEMRIEVCDVLWLDVVADEEIERRFFAMRPITKSQFDWPESAFSRLARVLGRGRKPLSTEEAVRAWERRLRGDALPPSG